VKAFKQIENQKFTLKSKAPPRKFQTFEEVKQRNSALLKLPESLKLSERGFGLCTYSWFFGNQLATSLIALNYQSSMISRSPYLITQLLQILLRNFPRRHHLNPPFTHLHHLLQHR